MTKAKADKVEVNPVQNVLNNVPDDIAGVVVIGIKADGDMMVEGSSNNYSFIHHILNRAQFELIVHEKQRIMDVKGQEVETAVSE